MTKKEKKEAQAAMVFAALWGNEPSTARQLADISGNATTGEFCSEGDARSALHSFEKMGLVRETEKPIKTGRRSQKGYRLTNMGLQLADAIASWIDNE